jgi:hypothetical protein
MAEIDFGTVDIETAVDRAMAAYPCDVNNCAYVTLDVALDPGGAEAGRHRMAPDMMQGACSVARLAVFNHTNVEVPCGEAAFGVIDEWAEQGVPVAIDIKNEYINAMNEAFGEAK